MDYKDYQAGFKTNNFWFLKKTELISILLEKLNLPNNIKILNVGAGTGEDVLEIKKFGKVFVLDIDERPLSLIPDDLVEDKKIADACNIPYSDKMFDLVLSFDVLEHIENDKKAINEIQRVLRDNGVFVFTVPAYNFLFSAHDRYLSHFRRYNKKELEVLLSEFEKIDFGYWIFLLFFPFAFHRLIHKHSKYKILNIPKILDFIANKILSIENFFIKKGIKYPLGLSIYGICRNKMD